MWLLIITTIIGAGISVGAIFGTLNFVKKQAATSVEAEQAVIAAKITKASTELNELLKYTESYASRGQFDNILQQVESIKSELDGEKANLANIEGKLDSAQKIVEEKETAQQELKSAKEEDEEKLEELLSNYNDISSQSIALEQRLATSMKNLDQMLEEVGMTQENKAILTELQDALTSAGSTMRELITEHETLYGRLDNLRLQHEDLEEEYTKLVEQQLGE